MTASGDTGDTQPAEHRQSRGIMVVGGDLRISEFTISIGEDGKPSAGAPRVELRTDMWPFWLEEAIEEAVIASEVANQIPAVVEQLEDALEAGGATESIYGDLTQLVSRELRASMRAITSCAFAIDALYATVNARSPTHPHQAAWTKNRTARNVQVADTFRYHLQIGDATSVKEIPIPCISDLQYRDWAVHPGARFLGSQSIDQTSTTPWTGTSKPFVVKTQSLQLH